MKIWYINIIQNHVSEIANKMEPAVSVNIVNVGGIIKKKSGNVKASFQQSNSKRRSALQGTTVELFKNLYENLYYYKSMQY